MSEEKIKVKDLAAELNVPAKDLIAKAKEMGMLSVKVSASSVSEQEAGRLRERFAPSSDKPEIIVRRRKKTVEPSRKDEVETAADAEETVETVTESAEKAPVEAKAQDTAPSSARIISHPADKQAVAEKEVTAAVLEPVVEPEPTTIEAPVEASVEEAPEQVAAEVESKTTARVIRPAAFSAEPERNAAGEAVSSAPSVVTAPDSTSEGTSQEAKAEPAPSSQVRIISRPTPGQNESQPKRPVRQAEGQRSGPYRGAGRPAPAAPASAGAPAAPFQPASEGGEQGRKKRQKGRRTVEFGAENRSRDGEDQGWAKTGRRGKKGGRGKDSGPLGGTQPVKAVKRIIKVEEFIRVSDLAHQMGLKAGEIIKILFNLGVMATINQSLDVDTATLVAGEFGYEVERAGFFEEEVVNAHQAEDKEEDLQPRPPVVTIMGHVDHGKTSLLDALRKSSVVTGEAGGITQHIGAYHVTTKRGEIVFLDTPGHEAFTAMRARGAKVTDIVVLVVAADDGVMEQTREAISHSKAAGVPIMVAVNKMDKPEANPERVKRELSELGLVAEDWGGDTTFTYVSAKKREGLDELLELLALQAEILELKANPNKPATGYIVEAKLDKGRGSLGTVLIQQGTLRLGDAFVCGVHSGRVRAMFDDQGKKVKEAGPSIPVEVQGFEGVPEAGEQFVCIGDERTARRIAEARALKQRERELAKESKVTLETFLARKADDVEAVVLNLVVKSDVQGSLEAITEALHKLSTEKVSINVMHGGTGAISESDVLLASASNAIIIGFNVRPTTKAKELAETEKVDMRFYDIIYKLVEEIKSAMEGMLAPVSKEVFLGTADVRETFSVPKVGLVAGCHVSDGKIVRNCLARLLRDGVVIHNGKLGSLRRFKEDVREVAKGYECGIGLENYNDIKVGDVIEAYEIVEEAAKL